MANSDQFSTTDSFIRAIDRYKILERVGTGGMARVYRAVDTALDRDVAVKVLHEYLADDDTFRARFEREAKFLANFHHPNVVQIYDYATLEQGKSHFCYIVMTYLPGQSLEDVMNENRDKERLMPQAQVLQIVQGIAAALDYAHSMGMVHRDVKPANILFDATRQAVLTDFGIARMVESSTLTQENVAVGTPAYMSPEQAAGEDVDNRTDIYALGVILYELLAGKPPFGDDAGISVLLKHMSEPVPALTTHKHIENPYLDAVVQKALAKRPEDRYQTAPELADDLEKALANREPAATQQVVTDPPDAATAPIGHPVVTEHVITKPQRPNSVMGILAVGLAIVVLVLVAAFVLNMPGTGGTQPTPEQPPAVVLDDSEANVDSMVSELDADLAPSMTTIVNESFISEFTADDPLVGFYWSLETQVDEDRPGMVTRALMDDDIYRFANSIPGRAATTTLMDYQYSSDITIMADLTLEPEGPAHSGYGIVFHYMDAANYGVFAVDGNGNYSIWYLIDRQWRELRDAEEEWTSSPFVNPIGEQNRLRLEIRGDMLTGYVNDEQVLQVQDGSLGEGEVGLYLAIPRSGGNAAILTDRYEVIVANEDNTTSSMTVDTDAPDADLAMTEEPTS